MGWKSLKSQPVFSGSLFKPEIQRRCKTRDYSVVERSTWIMNQTVAPLRQGQLIETYYVPVCSASEIYANSYDLFLDRSRPVNMR